MKQQTGWAKCPICEGSGEVETSESKSIKQKADLEIMEYDFEVRKKPLLHPADCCVSVKERQERANEDIRRVESIKVPDVVENYPKTEHEPCPICKDQEFKGCLPVYGDAECKCIPCSSKQFAKRMQKGMQKGIWEIKTSLERLNNKGK